jgi:uncharacterized membrane protein YfcA
MGTVFVFCLAGLAIGFSLNALPILGHLLAPVLMLYIPNPLLVLGTLLPVVLCGDITTVYLHRKQISLQDLWGYLPGIILGLLLGYFVLKTSMQSVEIMKKVVAAMLFLPLILFLGRPFAKFSKWYEGFTPKFLLTTAAALFAIVGQMGGAIMGTYLLASLKQKQRFISTYSLVFLVINFLKLPLYIHLQVITLTSLQISLYAIPCLIAGSLIGKKLLHTIPEALFEKLIVMLIFLVSVGTLTL